MGAQPLACFDGISGASASGVAPGRRFGRMSHNVLPWERPAQLNHGGTLHGWRLEDFLYSHSSRWGTAL